MSPGSTTITDLLAQWRRGRRDRAGKRCDGIPHVVLDDACVERSARPGRSCAHLDNVIAVDEALTR